MARDLHDWAGHAIDVILVQAGAARLLQERVADGARRGAVTIEEVARGTIGRSTSWSTLRDEGDAGAAPRRRRWPPSTRSPSAIARPA